MSDFEIDDDGIQIDDVKAIRREGRDELEQQGHIGPAVGSQSRTVYVRYCEQCERIGKRGFRNLIHENGSLTVCSNRTACRKRWPKPAVEEG